MKKKSCSLRIVASLVVLGGSTALANECPSLLKQALQPVWEDAPLRWAAELTVKAGETTGGDDLDKTFNNEMLLLGLEYEVSPVFRFYAEGGVKYWNKTGPDGCDNDETSHAESGESEGYHGGRDVADGSTTQGGNNNCPTVDGNWSSKSHAGFRELYGEYTPESAVVRGGLQTMTAGDGLLLDERVLGLYAAYDLDAFRLQGGVGTVSYSFARNGEFCASRHNYRALYPYWQREISDDLGENNLAFFTASWFPGRQEESDDEFETFDTASEPLWEVRELGVTMLQQFGNGFSNDTSYAAAFIKNTIPFDIHLDLEIIGQFENSQNVVAYWASADKSFRFGAAGSTLVRAGYLGVSGNTEEARFAPAFDNLNLGEAIQMDAVDAPLYFGELNHTIPFAWPLTLGVLYAAQVEDEKARELDLSATLRPHFNLPDHSGFKNLVENVTIGAVYSQVEADNLDEAVTTWRLELRWAL